MSNMIFYHTTPTRVGGVLALVLALTFGSVSPGFAATPVGPSPLSAREPTVPKVTVSGPRSVIKTMPISRAIVAQGGTVRDAGYSQGEAVRGVHIRLTYQVCSISCTPVGPGTSLNEAGSTLRITATYSPYSTKVRTEIKVVPFLTEMPAIPKGAVVGEKVSAHYIAHPSVTGENFYVVFDVRDASGSQKLHYGSFTPGPSDIGKSVRVQVRSSWRNDAPRYTSTSVTITAPLTPEAPGEEANPVQVDNITPEAPIEETMPEPVDPVAPEVPTEEAAPISESIFENTGAPTISGELAVGRILTASGGLTWSPVPERLDWQWLRDGIPIPGAIHQTYKVSDSDIGFRISVRMTGSAPNFVPVVSESTQLNSVPSNRFTSTPRPIIQGSLVEGQTLTANVPSWTPLATHYTYQWLRNGTPIPRATNQKYKLTAADRGRVIQVRVTGSRENVFTEVVSANSRPVAASVPTGWKKVNGILVRG